MSDNPTPVDVDLREQIASAIDHQIGDNSDVYEAADNVLAVVQPELDRLREQKEAGWNAALDGSNYAASLSERLGRSREVVARLESERDEARTDLERHQVLASFFTGDGSQPNYPGTPSFKAWIDTSQELATAQRELDAMSLTARQAFRALERRDKEIADLREKLTHAVVLPEDDARHIADVIERWEPELAKGDLPTELAQLVRSWRPSA